MSPKPGKLANKIPSYQPINLQSVMYKLFEKKTLLKQPQSLLVMNTVPNRQFSFRPGHATTEQVPTQQLNKSLHTL